MGAFSHGYLLAMEQPATPLTIVCFFWRRNKTGFKLPAVCDYSPKHIIRLRNGLKRHLHIPHRLVCVTDQPHLMPKGVEAIPLWDKCRDLGGCFNRLYTFSPAMRKLLGERFACIDLDCVIVGDVTPIFSRREDFIINRYCPTAFDKRPIPQFYNGGLFMMNAGARRHVWDTFDPLVSPALIHNNPCVVGTDQAWIRMVLGEGEATWGPEHGIYEARNIGDHPLPSNARIVMFAGKRDPSIANQPWVREHWK